MWYLSYSFLIIKFKGYLLPESKPRVILEKNFTAPNKFPYKIFIQHVTVSKER